MHTRQNYKLLLPLLLSVALWSCTDKKADQVNPQPPSSVTCDTGNLSFATDIMPIFQQKCATSGCHTNATQAGGYHYEDYSGIMQPVNNGRLLGAINHQPGFVPMPQNSAKLSDCEIAKITQWIAIGSPDN